MRVSTSNQGAMFSYVSLKDCIPKSHPLRKLHFLVDTVLATMDREWFRSRTEAKVPIERWR